MLAQLQPALNEMSVKLCVGLTVGVAGRVWWQLGMQPMLDLVAFLSGPPLSWAARQGMQQSLKHNGA